MREIKFRAWCKADIKMGEPLKFNMVVDEEAGELMFKMEKDPSFQYNAVCIFGDPDNWILEQYTGMKDVAGNEIWEGDIVERSIEFENRRVVRIIQFKNGSWRAQKSKSSSATTQNNVFAQKIYKTAFKVVGNIYENSELLNSDKNDERIVETDAK